MKFYIAFSIAGSNTFITATKETDDYVYVDNGKYVKIDNILFETVKSRRPSYNSEDGVKLHYFELNTLSARPTRSAPMVMKHFNTLAKLGWDVDKTKFIDRHWK